MIFDYQKELDKLKAMSKDEFMRLIDEVQHVKGFSSYYMVKWEVVESFLNESEITAINTLESDPKSQTEHQLECMEKVFEIENCFHVAGNFLFS